ncbi:winged helix-turn-helix domain-containing protein [Halomicroarcula sp. GCM10025709]|uniref:winged helix-turn-helix domain-containing protein n=1 Tax=Haloarcula TaxID=2237 RepID=UPI0024C43279|nr:winged helix-turn-helix domain-containing protein [Halomicroarcula sp. YJ-61-S]
MSPESRWTGDLNDAVVEEWVTETTPFERVREVLVTTASFQYASEIAERAQVSEPSARKHLTTLAESGLATTETTGQGTRFKRSAESMAMQRIKELHTTLSRAELVDGIQDLKTQIQSYQDDYGVTDPDDLALELGPDDDGWDEISHWRALEENLDVAQAALALYDFDPDVTGEHTGSGAFADSSDDISAD